MNIKEKIKNFFSPIVSFFKNIHQKFATIWTNKTYRRAIKITSSFLLIGLSFGIICIFATIKYSEIDDVVISVPVPTPGDKNIIVLDNVKQDHAVCDINDFSMGRTSTELGFLINYKNFNGAENPNETNKENTNEGDYYFTLTGDSQHSNQETTSFLSITNQGFVYWFIDHPVVNDTSSYVIITCDVKPKNFDNWYSSSYFYLELHWVS